MWFLLAYLICMIISVEIFCPMYKKFGLTSLYEYLEKRYDRSLRKAFEGALEKNIKILFLNIYFWASLRYFATMVYIVQNIIYNGMVIYMPSVALETVISQNGQLFGSLGEFASFIPPLEKFL